MFGSFALDLTQAQIAAIAGSVIPVIIGLLLFKIFASFFARTLVLVVALAVGGFIFLQRQEITDCVDEARANLSSPDQATAPIECTILGFDIKIDP